MESCGMSFIKYLLFAFNLIFAISGIGIIAAGATVLSDVSDFNHFADSALVGPPIVLIVTGVIVFIIAFLGCFGAIRESYNMLLAFAGLLLVIFILELAAGITAAVYKGDFISSPFKKIMSASMANYTENAVEREVWDGLQKKMKCCGVNGPQEWPGQGQQLPSSCCSPTQYDTEKDKADEYCRSTGKGEYLYGTGCYEKVKIKVESRTKVIIGVGIGIAFVEVVGIFLACWLAYTIKKEGTTAK